MDCHRAIGVRATVKENGGDLWTYLCQVRVIPTNGVVHKGLLVMGSGVAKDARVRFPHLPELLGRYVSQWGNRAFYLRGEGLISFPTKSHWRDPSPLELVLTSARQSVELVDKFGIESVALPRVGCGLGGLKWGEIAPLLSQILDNRFTVVIP